LLLLSSLEKTLAEISGEVMATILQLKDIGKVWHIERTNEEVVALGSITLDVQQGEFLILVGPSGCGKSTLLQIIAGLEEPDNGTLEIARSVDGQKQTGMVFQEFALFPWRTVSENIVFGPEVRSVPKAQREANAQKLIDLVHLKGFENRYPHELSGGMRQRVALARALANDPAILLFDEPLASLDAQTRKVLQAELVRIWQETKRTFIYVTHALEEAVLLGDRVVLFTARPGGIKEIVPVRLPRPRSITGRAEAELFEYLSEQIREEVERSLKAEGLT
jgi:NitT/TauT family transport system ATP-binding protein